MGVVGAMGNYTPNRSKSSQGGKTTDRIPGGGAGVQQRIETYKHSKGGTPNRTNAVPSDMKGSVSSTMGKGK